MRYTSSPESTKVNETLPGPCKNKSIALPGCVRYLHYSKQVNNKNQESCYVGENTNWLRVGLAVLFDSEVRACCDTCPGHVALKYLKVTLK